MQLFVRLVGGVVCAAILAACTEPLYYCTPDAATWRVTVLDTAGAPVTDLRWTAVIVRTQDTISATTLTAHSSPESGAYAVFTDDIRSRIDSTGEVVHVEGASGLSWFEADFVFAIPDAECHANRVSGPDTVTLESAPLEAVESEVWGGAEFRIVSLALRVAEDSIAFEVGTDTVLAHARRSDTVFIRAPSIAGTYTVSLLPYSDDPAAILEILVRGHVWTREGPPMSGYIRPWPRGSADPTFLANGPGHLQLFNAESGTVVRTFPDSIHDPTIYRDCTPGPGPTYDPDAFVLCPASWEREAWRLSGEEPQLLETLCGTTTKDRLAALIAPHRWLLGAYAWVTMQHCGPTPSATQTGVEEPGVVEISPTGDRVVVLGNVHRDGGAPVFDADGAVAYRLGAFEGSYYSFGAGFSPAGDMLHAAARRIGDVDTVRVVTVVAGTGEVIAMTEFPLDWPGSLLADPRGTWLYVLGIRDSRAVVVVLDPATLSAVAELDSGEQGCWDWRRPPGLVLGRRENAVYAVGTAGEWQLSTPPGAACVQRFDVPPR